jgi:hypothetical protein
MVVGTRVAKCVCHCDPCGDEGGRECEERRAQAGLQGDKRQSQPREPGTYWDGRLANSKGQAQSGVAYK